jgi:hypothetical protein
VQVQVHAEGDAGVEVEAEGVDVSAGESPTDAPVDAADVDFLVQVSKFSSARSNAVLKSGSCCFTRKLFMGGMV